MNHVIEAADAVVEAAEALADIDDLCDYAEVNGEIAAVHHAIGRYRFVVEQAVEQVEPWPDAKEIARLRAELVTLRARMEAIELLAAVTP